MGQGSKQSRFVAWSFLEKLNLLPRHPPH
jgi:23S rRNA A1618 N6-methylase RlmF